MASSLLRLGAALAVSVGLLSTAPCVCASNVVGAHVVQVVADYGGFFVYLDQPVNGSSCGQTSTTRRYVIDETTAVGKMQIATILSAQARGASISVTGMGSCPLWPDTESVQYVVVAS